MGKIGYGLKMWSVNQDVLGAAVDLIERGLFEYIELTTVPGTSFAPFAEMDVPYIVHAPVEVHGLNIADPSNDQRNAGLVDESLIWADRLGARYVVLHPGHGSIERSVEFLSNLEDDRVLVENMPKVGLDGEAMVGYTPLQIEALVGSRFGFCLDINHAIKASISLDVPYREFVERFLPLGPELFHVSDGSLSTETDEHVSIGEGEYDLIYILGCVTRFERPRVTLETGRRDLGSFDQDVRDREALERALGD